MLNYHVYFSDGHWWFEIVEVNPRKPGQVLEPLYRRRFCTAQEAYNCGEQALEHEYSKRKERAVPYYESN